MRKYFTLIEILGAVAIIAVLAAIGIASYSYALNSSKESDTRALLVRLHAAMDAASGRENFLPASGDDWAEVKFVRDSTTGAITEVDFGTTAVKKSDGKKYERHFFRDFLKHLDADTLSRYIDNGGFLTDAWGTRIYYRYPGFFNRGSYDFISGGSDGFFGKDSAAKPAKDMDMTQYRDSDGDWISDDIIK